MSREGKRRHVRRHAVEEHGILATHVRPGYRARLVNVSASGMLIETHHRLLPGTAVELQMDAKEGPWTVRGRVVRCSVVRVKPQSMAYRGAIAFECQLPWLADGNGYQVPGEQRPGAPFRADVTQDVI